MEQTLQYTKSRSLEVGQRVKVYLNWNKGYSVYSVADARSGLVAAYCGRVTLKDAKFRVSQAGRSRVINEQCKNVHAYVIGELIALDGAKPEELAERVYYDPYKTPEFIKESCNEEVKEAPLVHLQDRRAWIA